MAEGSDDSTDDLERIFTANGIGEMLVELLNGWREGRGDGQGFSTRAHIALVGTVYALAAHTHKLGFAVLEMRKAGFTIEVIPLVRAAYEAALTASWIAQVPDALPAYLNRNHNQQKALRDTIQKAGWASGRQVIPADELEPYLVSDLSKGGANYVNKLCDDFAGGDGMYGLYRGLSWMTHPTAAVTDMYLEMREGNDIPVLHTTARTDLDGPSMVTWLHVLCSSLVWSARALNLIDAERASSNERRRLRDAAKTLHVNEFLRVTQNAKFRGQKTERKRVSPTPNE
jgi:hypothetical protein